MWSFTSLTPPGAGGALAPRASGRDRKSPGPESNRAAPSLASHEPASPLACTPADHGPAARGSRSLGLRAGCDPTLSNWLPRG